MDFSFGFIAGFCLALLLSTGPSLSDTQRSAEYRRGYCEGRGGVEATVGDSIRCIRPPVAVDTARGR